MSDPRKKIYRQGRDPEVPDNARQVASDALYAATESGTETLKITGLSFVMLGITLWAEELVEIDQRATAQYFRSLADIFDAKNEAQARHAERKRYAAVERLCHSADLMFSEEGGRA